MNHVHWLSMEVAEKRQETPSLLYLKLTPKIEDSKIDFQAGQCVKILSPAGREAIFALASEPEEKRHIELLIKVQEAGVTHELARLKNGEQIRISPPFGRAYPVDRFKGKDLLLVGMGSALAPLRSLVKSILKKDNQFGKITFLYGTRTPAEVPFKNEFELWKKKINLYLAISQPGLSTWTGFLGRVTHLLPELHLQFDKTAACICGHRTMQEEVINLLERAGISKENVFTNH